jgi:general secretion pathway protein D
VATPPRDVTGTPAPSPTTPAAPGVTQILTTVGGTEFRIGGGPYTVPLSVNNASRLSVLTLTITYNPNVLRARTVQEGSLMSQGGVQAAFSQRIDAMAGRVDIAITRTGDKIGASAPAGLLAAILFDAVGPGGSMIQVSGVASAPDGSAIPLQFSSSTVTVR